MAKGWMFTAVDKIIADLSDRRGLGNEWDQIDEGVRLEIKAAWIQILDEEAQRG